jgi:hypothetical protein
MCQSIIKCHLSAQLITNHSAELRITLRLGDGLVFYNVKSGTEAEHCY